MEENNKFDLNEVKVYRTLEGTIFEMLTAIFIVVMYLTALTTRYFDFDNFQGKHLATIVLSVISIVLLVVAYSPKNINIGGQPKNIRQVELSIRATRIIAVEMALFCLLMVAISPDNPIIHTTFGVTLVVTALISTIFIHKSK